MHKAAVHQQVTQLIGQDELGRAAELLAQYWQPRNEPLYQATLAQIRRLHTLEQKQMKGLVSEDNANVEHARITDALLSLSSQLQSDRPELPRQLEDSVATPPTWKKWWPAVGLLLVLGVFALTWMNAGNRTTDSFSLTLHLQDQQNRTPVGGGQVKIVLGDYHLDPKEVNSNGQVIFNEIPAKYMEDSLQVIPVNLQYSVANQSANFPKESTHITVDMLPRPDSTLWIGRVVDQNNQLVAGAHIDIQSGKAAAISDANGNFQVAVPLPNNSYVRVVVRIDGRVLNDQRLTIVQDEPATLTINDPK